GHRGGWRRAKPLAGFTLLDIHQALGASSIFAIGLSTDHPECLVEQAVNEALGEAFEAAQALLLERLGSITLEQLASGFERRYWPCCDAWKGRSATAAAPAEARRRSGFRASTSP
ncbi:Rrf2 family transcriptional regulator, partial [Pseudomonas aeruginosa]